jgi:hypothetical protein
MSYLLERLQDSTQLMEASRPPFVTFCKLIRSPFPGPALDLLLAHKDEDVRPNVSNY